MMKLFKTKKGLSLSELPTVAMVLLVVAIMFAVALVILGSLATNSAVTGNAAAGTAVNKTIIAVGEIPNNWLLLIAVIIAAVIIVGLVLAGFSLKHEGRV